MVFSGQAAAEGGCYSGAERRIDSGEVRSVSQTLDWRYEGRFA